MKRILASYFVVFFVFIVLVSLGSWQSMRFFEKKQALENQKQALDSPAVFLPKGPINISQWHHRRAEVSGQFFEDKSIFISSRSFKGKVGFYVMTPLVRDEGEILWIRRGWVENIDQFKSRIVGQQRFVTVTGYMKAPAAQSIFMPDNQPHKQQWYFIDLLEMSRQVNVKFGQNLYMHMSNVNKLQIYDPLIIEPKIIDPFRHVSYALTWFFLALGLLMVFWRWKKSDI